MLPNDVRERPNRPAESLTKVPPSRKTNPDVTALIDHLAHIQHRVVQDAVAGARRSYWLRRAATFRAALPRQDDYHGREGLASVRARRDRIKAIISACEHAAEVALWQDGEPDGT